MNQSPQLSQLVGQVSDIFGKSQYPEFALQRVEEAIKNSKVSGDERNYILRMSREFVKTFVDQRENGPSPEERRQQEETDKRVQQMDARRLEKAKEISRKKKLEEYKKAHKYD